MPCSRTLPSSLKSWARSEQLISKDHMSWVQIPKNYKTESGPSVRRTEWLDRLWLLFRRPKTARLARKHQHLPRRVRPGHPCLIILVHLQLLLDRDLQCRSSPFVLAPAGETATDPIQINAARLRRLLQLPQPGDVTGSRWGLAWQTSPRTGGVCWATAGPPALSRTGWVWHSNKDLNWPTSASTSGPGTAGKTSSKPWMPCCWRGP